MSTHTSSPAARPRTAVPALTTSAASGLVVDGRLRAVLGDRTRPPRAGAVTASLTFAWRAMLRIRHTPEQLFDVTLTPLMMTVVMTYLFGGAIAGSTSAYLHYLLPGVLVMGVMFTTVYSGLTLNNDVTKGVTDRFRSLPVGRSAPLVGGLVGDTLRYAIGATVTLVVGIALGFRPDGGVAGVLAAFALLLVFASAVSWIFMTLGVVLRTPAAVNGAAMPVIFIFTFASNVFVQPETLPGWLQAFVNNSPVTHVVSAVRGLVHGTPEGSAIGLTLLWAAVLAAVFAPLTVRLYRRRA